MKSSLSIPQRSCAATNRHVFPDVFYPEGGDALANFSPIVGRFSEASDLQPLIQSAGLPLTDLAHAQANLLEPVWDAMAPVLNAGRPSEIKAFSPQDLSDIFTGVARLFGTLQVQTPALVPVLDDNPFARMLLQQSHGQVKFAQSTGPYGDADQLTPQARSFYGFMNFIQQGDGRDELVSVPVVGFSMLDHFLNAGQVQALRAFQRIVARVSHDHCHLMWPLKNASYMCDGMLDAKSYPAPLRQQFSDLAYAPWLETFEAQLALSPKQGEKIQIFEAQLLLLHRQVFKILLQNPVYLQSLNADIDTYLDGVSAAKSNLDTDAKDFGFAAANLLMAYFLRTVEPEHPFLLSVVRRMRDRGLDGPVSEDQCHTKTAALSRVLGHSAEYASASYGFFHDLSFDRFGPRVVSRSAQELDRARAGVNALGV